jgi:hypothetical protein
MQKRLQLTNQHNFDNLQEYEITAMIKPVKFIATPYFSVKRFLQ